VEKIRTWLDDEPGFSAGLRQAARLVRRSFSRPVMTLSVAIAITLALVGWVEYRHRHFAPRLVLRALEMDRDPATLPSPKRHLREYVVGAVFTSAPLFELIQKHGLYPGLSRKNQRAAIDTFREDIQVEVYQNYFIEERSAHQPPRSARVAISYRSQNRELALAVTRDLGQLLVQHEAKFRQALSAFAVKEATFTLERARAELARARTQLSSAWQRMESGQDRQAEVELYGLQHALPDLEARVVAAERRKGALDLGQALEKSSIGLTFQIVDAGNVPASATLEPVELVALGGLLFSVMFPLVALAIGAFDRTIRDADDVRVLGVPVLALIPGSKAFARGAA